MEDERFPSREIYFSSSVKATNENAVNFTYGLSSEYLAC